MAKRRRPSEGDRILKLEKKLSAAAAGSRATKSEVMAAAALMIAVCVSRMSPEGRFRIIFDMMRFIYEASEAQVGRKR